MKRFFISVLFFGFSFILIFAVIHFVSEENKKHPSLSLYDYPKAIVKNIENEVLKV